MLLYCNAQSWMHWAAKRGFPPDSRQQLDGSCSRQHSLLSMIIFRQSIKVAIVHLLDQQGCWLPTVCPSKDKIIIVRPNSNKLNPKSQKPSISLPNPLINNKNMWVKIVLGENRTHQFSVIIIAYTATLSTKPPCITYNDHQLSH
jgi:hypothetical protein